MKTYTYTTAAEAARALIKHLIELMEKEPDKTFHIAFSGGNSPLLVFDLWAEEFKNTTPWSRMRIYWVDERCVPAGDSESNYGNMRRVLFSKVDVPQENIYPINGSGTPSDEADVYSRIVRFNVPLSKGFPAFDIILLGVGEDGHTASIFPGQEHLLSSLSAYEVSVNPYTGQQRIGMTGSTLLNAKRLIFFVTGKGKAQVVHDVLNSGDTCPAAYVAHHAWVVDMFMDEQAGGGNADE